MRAMLQRIREYLRESADRKLMIGRLTVSRLTIFGIAAGILLAAVFALIYLVYGKRDTVLTYTRTDIDMGFSYRMKRNLLSYRSSDYLFTYDGERNAITFYELHGIDGYGVQVECDLSGGLPTFDLVGLPDTAVKEARERVRAAVKNSGCRFPVSRVTVNLAPAGTRKSGTLYDLPILLCLLAATGQLRLPEEKWAYLGEVSMGGDLRPLSGTLPMALAAGKAGIQTLVVPAENGPEATLAGDLTVYAPETVSDLCDHLTGMPNQ